MGTEQRWLTTALTALLIALPAPGAEVVDDFAEGGWRIYSERTPGELEAEKGRLLVIDLPGGTVTWGTAAVKRFDGIDLAATPYLVVNLAEVSNAFSIKLTGRRKDWSKTTVIQTTSPGLKIIDIPAATKWEGSGDIHVTMYANGPESRYVVSWVKFTGTLTEEEKAVMREAPKPLPKAPPFAGLAGLVSRRGMKPVACDPADGERTVYTDPVTGHEVWRMTDHPAIERHEYYDILAWNADGSRMLFLSRRAGGNLWLMNADGTGIHPLPQPADGGPIRAPRWSPINPHLVYFARAEAESVRILTMDVGNGELQEVVAAPFGEAIGERKFSEMPPPHPDGRHFLLRYGGQDRLSTLLVVADAETGTCRQLDVGMPTHRVRFTKAPDLSVFVNSNVDPEDPEKKLRTEWIVSLDGSKRQLPSGGGHPDWTPDGSWLGVFGGGGIWLISHDGKVKKELVHTGAGGHGGFSITTGRYHVADSPRSGPYGNLVYVTELANGVVTPVAHHGSSYSGWSSKVPDPEATHPAPICSPDETKIVYDSDLLGQPDVWVAVWKRPGTPRNVRLSGDTLSWQAPELHREIAGYNVHHLLAGYWELLKPEVKSLSLAGLGPGTYAVSAQEWSGLESRYAVANGDGATCDSASPAAPGLPRVTETSATYVALRWPAVDCPDLDHYNVYAVAEPDGAPSLASLAGSPKATRFTDWGRAPGTTFRYHVTAVDRQGHESLPSPAVQVTTDAVPEANVRVEFEAEAGDVRAPMVVVKDKSASGAAYVHVPDEHSDAAYVLEGEVRLSFDLPQHGAYVFWGRAAGPNGESNSFFLSVDGSQPTSWGVPTAKGGAPRFGWSRMSGLEGVPLKKGRHELVISCREDGARIDRIVVTNNWDEEVTD